MKKSIIYSLVLILISIGTVSVLLMNCFIFSNHFSADELISHSSYNSDIPTTKLAGFSDSYAVIAPDTEINSELFSDNTYCSLLVDNTSCEVLEAHNAVRRIYPASMTKLMTAIVVCDAIDSGSLSLDDTVTLQKKVVFSDSDVMASSLNKGYTITVRNLMYGLLMKSYNDYAVILAETVAGSVEDFAELMNRKAYEIGATNSHFVNPHGLHDDNHYTTAYDLYLIINEAHKYDLINEIDSYKSFSYTYLDSNNNVIAADITPTNAFLAERVTLPSNIKIITWKTGTTHMAGYCLAMIAEINGKPYTMVICDSESSDDLYNSMCMLFNLTN